MAVRTLAVSLLVAATLLGSSACSSRRGSTLQPPRGATTAASLPAWVGKPMSWDKLVEIQAWLTTRDAGRDPFWRIEGELLLADGRQSLAREEAGRPGTGTQTERLGASETGFRRVVDDPRATPEQVLRARSGLRRLASARPMDATLNLVPEIFRRERWSARPANPSNLTRNRRAWKWLTIHHSALEGAERLDGSLAATQRALRVIQNAHMNSRGYGDIGYHFLIGPGGRIFQGRDLAWQGAHVRADNRADLNPGNIGVCVIGNFEKEKPSQAAVVALTRLTQALQRQYDIPAARIRAHQDWKATACPGKNLMPFVERLK